MIPFSQFIQDADPDVPGHFIIPKATLIEELKSGSFEPIALFEIISDPFQAGMEEYVRKVRAETDQAVSVVVLIEKER